MAEKSKLSGGTVPREGGEYDKFVQDNIGKAIIGTPVRDGGIKPLDNTNTVVNMNPTIVELPIGLTPTQQLAMQAAFKAIVEGKNLVPVNPVANVPVQRDMIVPDNQTRAWNPMTPFQPTARLSDMEASVGNANANPNAVISHARPNTNLNPKDGCSPVLIDAFNLLTSLVAGRWLLPGAPSVETTLIRLRREIEDK